MSTTSQRRSRRRSAQQSTAYGLMMQFERTIAETVEAVIRRGLRQSQADLAARERASAAWREPLQLLAAEELSRRHAHAVSDKRPVALSPAALRRSLMPYSSLVAVAARKEMERHPSIFMAAD